MQRFGVGAVTSVLLFLGACVSQPEVPADTLTYATASTDAETLQEIRTHAKSIPVVPVAQADEVVCVREAPPGSLIPVQHCYTQSQLAEEARRTREALSFDLFEANAPL